MFSFLQFIVPHLLTERAILMPEKTMALNTCNYSIFSDYLYKIGNGRNYLEEKNAYFLSNRWRSVEKLIRKSFSRPPNHPLQKKTNIEIRNPK
jgi:hypothetical protein